MNDRTPYDLCALCFSLGCLPLLFLAQLPTISYYWGLILILFIIVIVVLFIRKITLIASGMVLAGFLWSIEQAADYMQTVAHHIDKKMTIQGTIKSLNIDAVNADKQGYYVNVDIQKINNQSLNNTLIISLFWQNKPFPAAGEVWQLAVKTKAAHSYLNQGSFDSQRFAMANRRILLGTVLDAQKIVGNKGWRQWLVDKTLPYANLFEHGDIMLALGFGERGRLTSSHKTVMFHTGIAHLMAISGMHIVLVVFLAIKLVRGLQYFLPIRLIYYWMPLLIAFSCAVFYGWLSGLNPPVMRALLALFLWQCLSIKKISLSSWQVINRIIAILLFIDPLMILSESFWLSCYAVVCLIFIAQWFPVNTQANYQKSYLFQLIKLQFLLTLLLLPIQFVVFNGISGAAIIANLIAIPLISFITFPAVLLMLIMSFFDYFYLAIWFGTIAEQSLSGLFWILRFFSDYWFVVAEAFYLLSGIGWLAIIVWQTRMWRNYWISLLLLLAIMISPLIKQKKSHWQIDMLDVGHGLAMVIRQGNSAILYDTGAMWHNSSAAERIILPFLKWHNLTVEGIIISHEHNDHIGGLAVIKHYFPHAWLMSSSQQLANDYICQIGEELNWQNLQLTVLWPEVIQPVAFNQQSCVVRISDGQYSILLTGDLERAQEQQLVVKHQALLQSTVLQMPHHASNTSSYYAFLAKVQPNVSLGSVARYNPWQLPAKKTLLRYQDLNLSYHLTAFTGQISIKFYRERWVIETMRSEIKPRWYHDWFGGLPNYR